MSLEEAINDIQADRKATELRAFFPPERIEWSGHTAGAKAGEAVTCVPSVAVDAIRDRLDAVLGPDNWRERYDNPKSGDSEYTRCVLEVRYYSGGDWVSRVGLSNAKKLDRAHAEALRAAALSLGIGRYLVLYPQAIEWDGAKIVRAPHLPDGALPDEYRKCGREIGLKVRNLVNTCADESSKRGKPVDRKEAAKRLAHECGGYAPDESGEVDFSRMQARHAAEAMRKCNDWLAALARGQVGQVDTTPAVQSQAPEKEKTEKGTPSQTPQGKAT